MTVEKNVSVSMEAFYSFTHSTKEYDRVSPETGQIVRVKIGLSTKCKQKISLGQLSNRFPSNP